MPQKKEKRKIIYTRRRIEHTSKYIYTDKCVHVYEREREFLPGSVDKVGEAEISFDYNLCVLCVESACQKSLSRLSQNMKNAMHVIKREKSKQRKTERGLKFERVVFNY